MPDTPPRPMGVYLLPNLLTTAGLLAGFYAIIAAGDGRFLSAAQAIFVAMLMDGLDGRVARLTNTESRFGVEYDSLCDMVSFGVAPAMLLYEWSLVSLLSWGSAWGKIAWLGAFVYVAGAALRLARFNIQRGIIEDKRYFQGLPSPAAALTMASLVWAAADMRIPAQSIPLPALFLTVLTGLFMVSNFRYYSFKTVYLKNRLPFFVAILIVLSLALLALDPAKLFAIISISYLLSGPFVSIFGRPKRNRRLVRAPLSDEGDKPSNL